MNVWEENLPDFDQKAIGAKYKGVNKEPMDQAETAVWGKIQELALRFQQAGRVACRGMRLRDNRALPRIAQMCRSTFALSRGRTGLGSRGERQDQAPSCRLRALVRPEIPLTSRHRSFQSCWQSGHAKQDFMHTYRAGVPESRIGTPIFSADFMSGAYASCSGVYQALGIDTRNQRKAMERV